MQLAFRWVDLLEIAFCLVALWMGIRDLQGRDPLIHTFFNQYDRDPEYRAMWQKKNGVWEICNAVCIGSRLLLRDHPALCNGLSTVLLVVDILYLVLYEAWEHSAD